MDLLTRPSLDAFKKASNYIKIMDQTQNSLQSSSAFVSKVAKNLKSIKAPVLRYFDSPGQISSYHSEGEYDLISVFKLLKYESYFFKASQKKISLLTKSGFTIVSDNDEVTDYFDKRFLMMQLQTGISLDTIIKRTGKYLIDCSNAFIVKVRDKDCEFAKSYTRDNKEMQPVVGYFLAHPTTMKPKFKYVKERGVYKWILDKWVQTNRRGLVIEFDKDDVIHFAIHKEDGMILGMPEIIPVIDDIRTLRKIEEDIQLLIYRDLFPIIHYTVDKPVVLDHQSGRTELDKAQNDMQYIVQDGGIATDARHEIKFIGSQGKSMDVSPYLTHFQQRVWTGLGVSALDMSVAGGAGGETSAQSVSNTLIDSVKFIQDELAKQFEEHVIIELSLQSPFDDILAPENRPKLKFEEIDIEWKIRQENHEADLFAKGSKTIHEVRNKRGDKTLSDDDMMYLHGSMFGSTPAHPVMLNTEYGDKYVEQEGRLAHATTVETTTTTNQAGSPAKKTHVKPVSGPTQSAAKRDSIKSAGTNSNIVKKKATDSIRLNDTQDSISLKDKFISAVSKLKDDNKINKKFNLVFATKYIYDDIKNNMIKKINDGVEDASYDLGVDSSNIKVTHNIFGKLNDLRDSVCDMVFKDPSTINKAANRIALTDRTEQARGYNYGVFLAALNSGAEKLVIYHDLEDLSDDSSEHIGKELDVANIRIEDLPPYRPNQRLYVRIKV